MLYYLRLSLASLHFFSISLRDSVPPLSELPKYGSFGKTRAGHRIQPNVREGLWSSRRLILVHSLFSSYVGVAGVGQFQGSVLFQYRFYANHFTSALHI